MVEGWLGRVAGRLLCLVSLFLGMEMEGRWRMRRWREEMVMGGRWRWRRWRWGWGWKGDGDGDDVFKDWEGWQVGRMSEVSFVQEL